MVRITVQSPKWLLIQSVDEAVMSVVQNPPPPWNPAACAKFPSPEQL